MTCAGGDFLALPSVSVRHILGVLVAQAVRRERDGQGGHWGGNNARSDLLRKVPHVRRMPGILVAALRF